MGPNEKTGMFDPDNPNQLDSVKKVWLTVNIIGQVALGLVVMTVTLPSMQEWAAIFGSTQAAVQLTFSGYVLAYGVLQLVYGPLSDQLGRKKVLLFGLSLVIGGSFLAFIAESLQALVVARIIQGMGCASGMVIGRAMVQDFFAPSERTRIMAYLGMTMGVIPPLATILGGYLHVHLGWRSNFLLLTCLAAALLIAAWRGLPASSRSLDGGTHWARTMATSYKRLIQEPVFLLHVVVVSCATGSFYLFLAGAPMVLGGLGVYPDGIGMYVMIGPLSYIVGNFLTSQLAHRTKSIVMMWLGQSLAVTGVSIMVFLAFIGTNTPLAFALPMALLGLGHGFLMPPALAGTVGLIPSLAGSAAAVAGLSQQSLGAIGGALVGFLPTINALSLGSLMLSLVLAGVIAQFFLPAGDKSQ